MMELVTAAVAPIASLLKIPDTVWIGPAGLLDAHRDGGISAVARVPVTCTSECDVALAHGPHASLSVPHALAVGDRSVGSHSRYCSGAGLWRL